jgi:hypothetical protein
MTNCPQRIARSDPDDAFKKRIPSLGSMPGDRHSGSKVWKAPDREISEPRENRGKVIAHRDLQLTVRRTYGSHVEIPESWRAHQHRLRRQKILGADQEVLRVGLTMGKAL